MDSEFVVWKALISIDLVSMFEHLKQGLIKGFGNC